MTNDGRFETGWRDPNVTEHLLIRAAIMASGTSCCVLCTSGQPADIRWPGYTIDILDTDGEVEHVHFVSCPKCEKVVDSLLLRMTHDDTTDEKLPN